MKKVFTTILAFVYLCVSTGASIQLHYCMGKLMSWDMSQKHKTKCNVCGMEKTGHKGCCKDEQKILQIDKDQSISGLSYLIHSQLSEAISTSYATLPSIYPSSITLENPLAHAPPAIGKVPVFLLNRNFRI